MRFHQYAPAVVALGAGLVAAQQVCDEDITITTNQQTLSCRDDTIRGDLIIDPDVEGDVIISGIERITGSLNVTGNTNSRLTGISSTDLQTIGDTLYLSDLGLLRTVSLTALTSVETIQLQRLGQLDAPIFGDDEDFEATDVEIIDTNISDLSGLRLTTVNTIEIANNRRLATFESQLTNVTGSVTIRANGDNMTVTMDDLESANELQISNVGTFSVPALTEVSRLNLVTNPELRNFTASNLTAIGESLTINDNRRIANASFPSLTEINGDMTIQNNTALIHLNGFPQLTRVFGAILLRGSFESIEIPELNQISSTVNVTSTTDIAEFCDFFQEAEDNGQIDGGMSCTSNNDLANEREGDNGEETRGDGSTGGSGDDDEPDAAGNVNVNTAMLALALMAAFAQLL